MGTFMAAYLAVWIAVVVYVGRMGVRQHRLQQSLEALQERANHELEKRQTRAKSA